jgi:hypothetical protein
MQHGATTNAVLSIFSRHDSHINKTFYTHQVLHWTHEDHLVYPASFALDSLLPLNFLYTQQVLHWIRFLYLISLGELVQHLA